jgi:hypothetical protein
MVLFPNFYYFRMKNSEIIHLIQAVFSPQQAAATAKHGSNSFRPFRPEGIIRLFL